MIRDRTKEQGRRGTNSRPSLQGLIEEWGNNLGIGVKCAPVVHLFDEGERVRDFKTPREDRKDGLILNPQEGPLGDLSTKVDFCYDGCQVRCSTTAELATNFETPNNRSRQQERSHIPNTLVKAVPNLPSRRPRLVEAKNVRELAMFQQTPSNGTHGIVNLRGLARRKKWKCVA